MTIDKFLDNLRRIEDTDNMKNPYLNSIQVKNLSIYLSHMIEASPNAIFVGEAPGYLGCALTGIPFTDEYRLTAEGSVCCPPLLCCGYVIAEQNCFFPHKETSASVMWSSFVDNSFFPMLWNIFPFHPHKKGSTHSNRTPTLREIKEHICFMDDVRALLPSIKHIYAVGRKAEDVLSRMGIEADYIRHPAHGGAKECRERVGEIAKRGQPQWNLH